MALIDAFKEQINKLDQKMKDAGRSEEDKGNKEETKTITSLLLESAIAEVKGYVRDFIKAKYKVKFMGIINALTGGPSTPWHITIGNPLRPIFCSGDMLCKDVTVNFGPQLSFNDLPTFIEVQVQLESARNLGLQEIFAKFNAGGIRVTEGDLKGTYTFGEAISFWNTENFSKNSENTTSTSTPTKAGQESNQADESADTTNKSPNVVSQGLESKVQETPVGANITPSTTSDLQCNPDASSETPIIPAGTDANTQEIRTDATQESTGNTEGFTDQKQNPENVPNSGEDSKTIQEKTTTGVVKTISEEVDIVAGGLSTLYIITGTYDIDGKQVIGKGAASSEDAAKTKAKQDALKKSK